MSIASAQLRYSFGLKGDVKQNVGYLDEQTIVYPAGTNLVLLNIDQKVQKFLPFSQAGGDGASAMCVSPNRRYVAIAERNSDKPTINIFDVQTMRRRKVLSCTDVTANEFVSLAFSSDSKYLIGQSGESDWTLLYWQWEKSNLLATTKVIQTPGSTVNQVSFNPKDNTQVCVVGDKTFKLFRYNEGSLKQFAFTKVEPLNYLSHTWLSEERLLLGTDKGKVQLFEVADLRNEFIVNQPSSNPTSRSNSRFTLENSPASVHAILPYSKGFICSSGPGTICLFEKTEDKNVYKCVRPVSLSSDQDCSEDLVVDDSEIMSIAFSPSEESVVCSTQSQQLYILTLSAADVDKGAFEHLTSSFHHGPISGMGTCLRKPIIATCSLDKSIRIWNYESNSLELTKEFQEEAYSVALHPSGLFLLVGFSEKLRLMNILIDDIKPYKEFMIRGCRECSFSRGGHLFAASNSNLVQVYSTFSFENTINLKGHNGKVRSILWSQDDSRLVSCCTEGAVYEWNIFNGKREKEYVLKGCAFSCVSSSPDLKSVFAVGSDHMLKELSLADSQMMHQVNGGDVVFTQVVFSYSGKMLIAGTSNGTIRAVKYPLTDPGEWQEHLAHSSSVTRMRISHDDQYLFSVGDDGTLFIFRIFDKESRMIKREREAGYAEEVLITRTDLEEKNTLISEWKTRVDELKMENDYQLRLKNLNYEEQVKDLTDKYMQEIESLKAKNETLSVDKEHSEARYKDEFQQMLESHSTELQERENTTSAKLMGEYEKYQELQARSQRLQEDYERQLQNMEEAREKALQELTEHYEKKLRQLQIKLEEAGDEYRQLQKESDEMQNQMEEDTDEEILSLKNRYERQLRQQTDENLKLRGDTGILRKKVDGLQGEIVGLKSEITVLNQEVKKRDGIIESLRTDIVSLKKEIQERDDTIRDKEQRILDMKKKNQELEKFKFVLDYKIKELRRQMEPRENEIKSAKEQIGKMEVELGNYSKDNSELLRQLEQQELKLKATTKELMKERQFVHDLKVQMDNIKSSLHSTSSYIQEPKELKEAMIELYKKYLKDYDRANCLDAGSDVDMHKEYSRQRHHMEKTVASLRKKLQKDTDIHRMEKIRVMQENVSLLKEINDLRRELKVIRSQAHDFEAAIKIARKNGFNDRSVLAAIKASPPPTDLGKIEPNNDSRVMELQKQEIGKLRSKIRELEGIQLTNKLPPLLPQQY